MDKISQLEKEYIKILTRKEVNKITNRMNIVFQDIEKYTKSPIERIFALSLVNIIEREDLGIVTFASFNKVWFDEKNLFELQNKENLEEAASFYPGKTFYLIISQFPVKNYFADFLIIKQGLKSPLWPEYLLSNPNCIKGAYRENKRAIIECDGHQWHEKTKEQAQYDKARDRVIQGHGFPVLHFTGSEINRSPEICGLETIQFLNRIEPYEKFEDIIY